MNNYNDDKVKAILESEEVPAKLQPENIKKMLDDTNAVKKRRQIKRNRIIRTVSAAAAFVLVFTVGAYYAKPLIERNNIIVMDETDSKTDDYTQYLQITNQRPESIGNLSYAKSYEDVYNLYIEPNKTSFLDRLKDKMNMGSIKYDTEIYEEDFDYVTDGAVAENEVAAGEMDGTVLGEEQNSDIPNYEYKEENGSAENGTAGGMGEGTHDYSETHNQEEDVFEADIVKTNGEQIFFSTDEKIVCSEVENGIFKNNSTITPLDDIEEINGDRIEEMYLFDGTLIVIGSGFRYIYENDTKIRSTDIVTFVSRYDTQTLELASYYVQDGYYVDVRMTVALCLITNKSMYFAWDDIGSDDYETYIPSCNLDGEESLCEASDILIPEECEEPASELDYTIISSINLLNEDEKLHVMDTQIITGGVSVVYCTSKNLYTVSGYAQSDITRFKISDELIPEAACTIDGYVNDQFSLSEHNGYLRVATTVDEYALSLKKNPGAYPDMAYSYNNCLYVLDKNDLSVVGKVKDFGLDETIKSVSYDGDMAYVVTFRQTDPLYAIDVSAPENPVILDEFKITGYSSYMQKWSDGLLVGFGVEADENGWQTGVKLTMFDNSDPENLEALATISITEDYDSISGVYSEGVSDRKALYIDPERNIIGFPLLKYNYAYTYAVCSYEFYSFENGEFKPLGSMYKNYYDKNIFKENFKRAVYIDGYLYALSGDMFISANAETFEQADLCEFEQHDYSELKEELICE